MSTSTIVVHAPPCDGSGPCGGRSAGASATAARAARASTTSRLARLARAVGAAGSVRPVGRLHVERSLGLRLSRRASALDEREHVPLADPAADPGSRHLRQVDAVLVGDPPHDRRVIRSGPARRPARGRGAGAPAALRGAPAVWVLACLSLLGLRLPGAPVSISPAASRPPRSRRPPRGSRSTRPLAGDGISTSILSVEMSQIGSSASTQSPGRLRHATIVPSATETPICGIVTSTELSVCEELTARLLHVVELRQHGLLERGLNGIGTSGRGQPPHRRVEVLERLLRRSARPPRRRRRMSVSPRARPGPCRSCAREPGSCRDRAGSQRAQVDASRCPRRARAAACSRAGRLDP